MRDAGIHLHHGVQTNFRFCTYALHYSHRMAVSLIYDPEYLRHDTGPHHPETAYRLRAILKAINESDTGSRLQTVKPTPAHREDLARCHHDELVDHVKALCERGEQFVDIDTRISRESYDVALLAAGAAITAVDGAM